MRWSREYLTVARWLQVGFKDQKLIRKTKVDTRINAIVNRLNATKREEYPDLAAEREAYDKEVGVINVLWDTSALSTMSHLKWAEDLFT